MIQGPLVIGQQPQVGLNILDGELPGRAVGFRYGQDQTAVAQRQRFNLEFQPGQCRLVE